MHPRIVSMPRTVRRLSRTRRPVPPRAVHSSLPEDLLRHLPGPDAWFRVLRDAVGHRGKASHSAASVPIAFQHFLRQTSSRQLLASAAAISSLETGSQEELIQHPFRPPPPLQCFCATTLPDGTSFEPEHDGCTSTCSGFPGETCGGWFKRENIPTFHRVLRLIFSLLLLRRCRS